jgi:hypothetical protein
MVMGLSGDGKPRGYCASFNMLKAGCYEDVDELIGGAAIRAELRQMCRAAQSTARRTQ